MMRVCRSVHKDFVNATCYKDAFAIVRKKLTGDEPTSPTTVESDGEQESEVNPVAEAVTTISTGSEGVPSTTDIRHLVRGIVRSEMCAHGYTWYVCEIYATPDDATKENDKAMYFRTLSENDIDPKMLQEYQEANSKKSRHSRNKKEDTDKVLPFISGEDFDKSRGNTRGNIFTCASGGTCMLFLCSGMYPRGHMIVCVMPLTFCSSTFLCCLGTTRGKTRPKTNSKSGVKTTSTKTAAKSPVVAINETGFEKREIELGRILAGDRLQSSAASFGGRRDALTKLAKTQGLSSDCLSGWVEMQEQYQTLVLTNRQRVLTRQYLRRSCGYVKYGSPEDGPSATFLNCECPVSGFNYLPSYLLLPL